MSQPISAHQRSLRVEQIRRQIAQFRGSRSQGMFGMAELLGVSVAALIVLAVLVAYFYFLVPARSNLELQQRERARLQTLLHTSSAAMQKEQDTKQIVERITASMDEFEIQHLAHQTQGRMDLYEELNQLIKKNGLSNTSGPTYTNLEPITARAGNRSSGGAKWQSVYPGIAVAVTVEGPFQNLRRFVRDLETSKQFIIINAVELERAETNSGTPADGATAGSRGSLVSLRMDLATYFQRNAVINPAVSGDQK